MTRLFVHTLVPLLALALAGPALAQLSSPVPRGR